MTKGMYVTGDFNLDELIKLVKDAFDIGVKKAVIVHRNSKGKRIGQFEIEKEGAFEYFPESKEGEKFSYKLSELLRKWGKLPVKDVYDL